MFSQTFGSTVLGLNGLLITVEVDIADGLPAFDIVGLPDAAVRESRERVRSAIKNSGFKFPARRITINLAPADLKKDSSGLDLPIAIGILLSSEQLIWNDCQKYLFIGELSLEGRLRGVSGILPMAINCCEQKITNMVVAPDNVQEALLVADITVFAPLTLQELVMHLSSVTKLTAQIKQPLKKILTASTEDFADVQGQVVAKRALEIAAAGGHNVLLTGSPGSGKTMLARRITSIMPVMSLQESLEITKIYSVADLLHTHSGLVTTRPFRSPHHSISAAGMVGGGRIPKPGEVTLSHNGVLFLDELAEFPRMVLEGLRQPLEDGHITISRINSTLVYPAKFLLISAMNPCICGYFQDEGQLCSCTNADIKRYRKRISGPLLDRMDLYIHVPRLEYNEMVNQRPAESSAVIRERVAKARAIQCARLSKYNIFCNAHMGHKHIRLACQLTSEAELILKNAFTKMNLSARGYDRILKVARTIADLDEAAQITALNIAEAVHFRNNMQEIY